MNRTPYAISHTLAREEIRAWGCVQGAAAAAPTIPSTVTSGTASSNWMSALDNFVSSVAGDITRSGVGVYTVKFKDSIPVILNIIPTVWGLDGKPAQPGEYNASTRVLTFRTWAGATVATDLATTDFVHFSITGKLVTENA